MDLLSRAIGRLETLESGFIFILEDLMTKQEWLNLQSLKQTHSLGRKFKKVVDLKVLSVEALPDNGGTQRYKKI
ncbi:DUF1413 domain-containing protein [Romboutsia sp.]|uniref:DUF1413 domain-containing protein n=1 Tax=Romboutsia sp. TaxID=1965302 RepID=UPI003F3F7280